MTAGHIYRIAGNGQAGDSGNGGLATRAGLSCAAAAAIDHAGNVVIVDCGQVRVLAERTGASMASTWSLVTFTRSPARTPRATQVTADQRGRPA